MGKLVRDKIPEIMISRNQNPNTKTIEDDKEYLQALTKKLLEEANELIEVIHNNDENAQKEIADIFEVIDAICNLKNYNLNFINEIKIKKHKERGGFSKRIFLFLEEK